MAKSDSGDPVRIAKSMIRLAKTLQLMAIDDQPVNPAVALNVQTDCDGTLIFSNASRVNADQSCVVEIEGLINPDQTLPPRLRMEGNLIAIEPADSARIVSRLQHSHANTRVTPRDDRKLLRIEPLAARLHLTAGESVDISARRLKVAFADWSAWHQMEAGAVAHMNEDHRDATRLYATVLCGAPDGDWRIRGLDPEGIDMQCDDLRERLWFRTPLTATQQLRPTLVALAKAAREAGE